MIQLTDNVFVETGFPGANVGFVTTESGIVMIESPMRPSDAVDWREQMKSRGETVCLLHTEGHHDHVYGDYFFNVPVICHEKARDQIMSVDIEEVGKQIVRLLL